MKKGDFIWQDALWMFIGYAMLAGILWFVWWLTHGPLPVAPH